MRLRPFTLLTLAFLAASLLPAQPPADGGPEPQAGASQPGEDPPSRAARLSFLTGTVSFQPGGVEDWVPAALNRPLTTGDQLWTEGGSRAELNLGSAALRLNSRTNFTFLNLDDGITQVQLSSGTLSVRLRRLDDRETFEIDTPQIAFTLQRPGEYRVEVNERGDATLVTVRAGQGEAVAGDQTQPIYARQQVRASETGNAPLVFDERDAPVADGFDNFCMDRDRREDRSESARHVSREMPGYADLDANGVWREDQQYGWIWAPRVDPGWAPYHDGHWAWIAPWGWTWVDDAPWGYAPFHYGRWANAGGVWVWVPGPPAVRPVYAPALVAWVGGPRLGVSLAIGGGAAVGWFALGPGEIWAPAYRASPRYFTQVNISNTVVSRNVNITNVYTNVYVNRTDTNFTYVNRNVNGAVTAVPQNAMVTGRPVAQAG
ncbi:MAG: FecR protein, partial [Acidobacteriota bacterium]|nr:FecR protein [Acidobacteriota bacterium]